MNIKKNSLKDKLKINSFASSANKKPPTADATKYKQLSDKHDRVKKDKDEKKVMEKKL